MLFRSQLPAAEFSDVFPVLPFEECDVTEFLSDLICDRNACSRLYDFVSDAYDELVEEDKESWKGRVKAIDALVGNTDVHFGKSDDVYDEDMDADELADG